MLPDSKTLRLDYRTFQFILEKKLTDLPSMPAAIGHILQSINNPDVSTVELQRIIAMDSGLASKILRVANSAHYGYSRRVTALSQALMIIGITTVRNLVIGISALGMLSKKEMPYGLNGRVFWEHCVATALGASHLAKLRLPHIKEAAEEAFIGGMLHDIGALFLDNFFSKEYAVATAFAQRENKPIREAELMVIGIDHSHVGRRIAEHWNFPPHFAKMIGAHHDPNSEQSCFDLTALVHAADWMAWESGHPSVAIAAKPALDAHVKRWLRFGDDQWERLTMEFHEQFQQNEELVRILAC